MSLETCPTCGRMKSGHAPDCAEHPLNAAHGVEADDDLWEEVIGDQFGPGYICADCFTRAADERVIQWEGRLKLVPISLASQIEIQSEVAYANARSDYPQYSEGDKFQNDYGEFLHILEFRGGGVVYKCSMVGSRVFASMSRFHNTVYGGRYEKQNVQGLPSLTDSED